MIDPREQDENEAAAWVARIDSGEWSPDREEELRHWLSADPRRQGMLVRAQALWLALDNDLFDERLQEPADSASRAIPRRAVLAGSFAALAASAAGLLIFTSGELVYDTRRGEIRQVRLDDGSLAMINTASKIEVKFKRDERVVELVRGEAWFKVAKDATRPFLVRAGDAWVRAVGTAFSVRRRLTGIEISVTEGIVQAGSIGNASRKLLIRAGGRAVVDVDRSMQLSTDPAKIERDLAWREGKIQLVGDQLGAAVDEFNRYNDRKIVLLDHRVATEQVDGVFSANDPESFALAVHTLLSVPVDMHDPQVIRIG